jgi:hypothetical protein
VFYFKLRRQAGNLSGVNPTMPNSPVQATLLIRSDRKRKLAQSQSVANNWVQPQSVGDN